MKRERLEIIKDILTSVRNKPAKKTHILYKANLSPQMLNDYLNILIKNKLIRIENKSYHITDKGREYVSKYRFITEFIGSFGLGEN